ncbi:NUDIX hydrolase [Nocardioides lentus]|uniref:NUDIX hydrolase n=1 Tax=Nocardioides lentus TaxID=338077 RepID=A0ABN2P8Z0_9ACTN
MAQRSAPSTSSDPSRSAKVAAAGAVVTRAGDDLPEVLLVHRPSYDDWSLPKGKVDPGEHPTRTAVREVEEETGLRVRLGPALRDQFYVVGHGRGARTKVVHYFVARVEGDDDVTGYRRGQEIDEVAWVPWLDALRLLTYPRDRDTVREAAALRRRADVLVVVRHGHARARKSWRRDDRVRPLTAAGARQAERLVPLLESYGVRRVLSSSSTRCVQTLTPYAEAHDRRLHTREELSEEGASASGVAEVIDDLRSRTGPAVVCTHRPVLPLVYDALGTHAARLEPGGLLVVHRRSGLVLAADELPAPRG